MSDYEREKQTLEDMDRTHGENLAKANEETNQDVAAEPQPTPYEDFKKLLSQLQTTTRAQQLKTEQAIQQTLQQAATALGDVRKVDMISRQIQAMQQALNQQGPRNNPQYFLKMLQQLGSDLQEQLHQSDQQVARAMQQAIAAMTQSQSAMFDSQAFCNLTEVLKQCEKTLQQWQNPSQNTVH